MGVAAFPVVSGAQVAAQSTTAKMEPGTIMAVRTQTDQWSIVEYVQLDNAGVSQGEVLIQNYATLKQYSVAKASTTDGGAPMRGIAAATIASQSFGFMYIGGYVEKADLSQTVASGEYIAIGASVAGKLSNDKASAFNLATVVNVSGQIIVAVARAAFATGIGSIQIMGIWG